MRSKAKDVELTPHDVASLMHTALRKACDSPITTIAYTLVHALSDGKWLAFVELLLKHRGKRPLHDSIWLNDALDHVYEEFPKDMALRTLLLVFREFDSEDRDGAVAFFGPQP